MVWIDDRTVKMQCEIMKSCKEKESKDVLDLEGNPDLDFEIRILNFPIKTRSPETDFSFSEIHLSVRQNPFLDFMFNWEIRNPDFKIQSRISQSKTPKKDTTSRTFC